jgi:hypothetical protein
MNVERRSGIPGNERRAGSGTAIAVGGHRSPRALRRTRKIRGDGRVEYYGGKGERYAVQRLGRFAGGDTRHIDEAKRTSWRVSAAVDVNVGNAPRRGQARRQPCGELPYVAPDIDANGDGFQIVVPVAANQCESFIRCHLFSIILFRCPFGDPRLDTI